MSFKNITKLFSRILKISQDYYGYLLINYRHRSLKLYSPEKALRILSERIFRIDEVRRLQETRLLLHQMPEAGLGHVWTVSQDLVQTGLLRRRHRLEVSRSSRQGAPTGCTQGHSPLDQDHR